MPLLPLLLNNWQLILKGVGIAVIAWLGYHYFITNPKKIDALEEDKKEQARIIKAKDEQLSLYQDIEKGRVRINETVQQRISSLRSEARPKRTVIIRAGSVLSPLPKAGTPSH